MSTLMFLFIILASVAGFVGTTATFFHSRTQRTLSNKKLL
jgi:hypothetical protein